MKECISKIISGKQRWYFLVAVVCFLISGRMTYAQEAEEIPDGLTIEEKVAQLFIVTPEALTGAWGFSAVDETFRGNYGAYPVGGLVFFQDNLLEVGQITEMLSQIQSVSRARIGLEAFLCVDEEGGDVRRLSGRVGQIPYIPSAMEIGQEGSDAAYAYGLQTGTYLKDMGFNVNFAPVADIWTNPNNSVIGSRAFGTEPGLTALMVSAYVSGLHDAGILATLKHFPGHGDTSEDSHLGSVVSYKTIEELRECELQPFLSGILAGGDFVMAGHISLPNVTGTDIPATLSHTLITGLLREELGFDGLVITDAMNMSAVSDRYASSGAAVQAILAGCDMILMPADFYAAYQGVLEAVLSGEISQERLDESVRRILRVKAALS